MQQIDLTHTVIHGMDVFPGDTPPHICHVEKFSETGINGYRVDSGMHVGTHIDAPLHMIDNGKKIPEFPVAKFHGRGVLINAQGQNQIHESLLDSVDLQPGDIILVDTGHHKLFGQPEYYQSWPEVAEGFAQKLVDAKVGLLGLDTPSPDNEPFPIHKILLGNDVLIIENITNLEPLHGVENFTITALPAKYDTEAAPTRVMATIGH